jgi:hypothetical protein
MDNIRLITGDLFRSVRKLSLLVSSSSADSSSDKEMLREEVDRIKRLTEQIEDEIGARQT